MYYNYLVKNDFIRRFQSNLFEELTNFKDETWQLQERYSLSEIATYLKVSYDISKEFMPFVIWSANTNYIAGQRVVYPDIATGSVYAVLQDILSTLPPSEDVSNYGNDNRCLTLVRSCVDIILYDLQCASTYQITEITNKRREEAISFLKDVMLRKFTIDLPKYEDKKDTQFNLITVDLDKQKTGFMPY